MTGVPSWMCSCLMPVVPAIESGSTTNLTGIKESDDVLLSLLFVCMCSMKTDQIKLLQNLKQNYQFCTDSNRRSESALKNVSESVFVLFIIYYYFESVWNIVFMLTVCTCSVTSVKELHLCSSTFSPLDVTKFCSLPSPPAQSHNPN